LPVTLNAEAGPEYGMILPNLISVSVIPGCSARAGADMVREIRAAKVSFLDRVTAHPPRLIADLCWLFCREG
jgi:hypothetical protein